MANYISDGTIYRLIESLDIKNAPGWSSEKEAKLKEQLNIDLPKIGRNMGVQRPLYWFYEISDPERAIEQAGNGKGFVFSNRVSCTAGHVEAAGDVALCWGNGASSDSVDFSFLTPGPNTTSYFKPAGDQARLLFSASATAATDRPVWFSNGERLPKNARTTCPALGIGGIFAVFQASTDWGRGHSGSMITFTDGFDSPHYLGYIVIARSKENHKLALAISLPRLLACPLLGLMDRIKLLLGHMDSIELWDKNSFSSFISGDLCLFRPVLVYFETYQCERGQQVRNDWELISHGVKYFRKELSPSFQESAGWIDAYLNPQAELNDPKATELNDLKEKITEYHEKGGKYKYVLKLRSSLAGGQFNYADAYRKAKQEQLEDRGFKHAVEPPADNKLLAKSLSKLPASTYDKHIVSNLPKELRMVVLFAECLDQFGKLSKNACWFLRYNNDKTIYSAMFKVQKLNNIYRGFNSSAPTEGWKGHPLPGGTWLDFPRDDAAGAAFTGEEGVRPYLYWPYTNHSRWVRDTFPFQQEENHLKSRKPGHAKLVVAHHPTLCERNPSRVLGSRKRRGQKK
ncbi:hypothetical protein DFS34DRAFT_197659 [Phlyctochytrium arcticum]|nr:hypothetical protein DFS34DRAFT_197659 [Phlyctochytrium arcticum]